jgi:hypothetical protein
MRVVWEYKLRSSMCFGVLVLIIGTSFKEREDVVSLHTIASWKGR